MATAALDDLETSAPFRFWITPVRLDTGVETIEMQVRGMGINGEEATAALVKVTDGEPQVVAATRQDIGSREPLRVAASTAAAYASSVADAFGGPDDQAAEGPISGLYAVVGLGHPDDETLEEEVLRRTRLPGPGLMPAGLVMRILRGGDFDYKGKPPWQINAMGPDTLMPEAIVNHATTPTRMVVVGSRPDPNDPSGSATTVSATRGSTNITATPFWIPRVNYAVVRIPIHGLKDETGGVTISWYDGTTTHYWYPTVQTVGDSSNRDVTHGGSINKKTNVYWDTDGVLIIGPWADL